MNVFSIAIFNEQIARQTLSCLIDMISCARSYISISSSYSTYFRIWSRTRIDDLSWTWILSKLNSHVRIDVRFFFPVHMNSFDLLKTRCKEFSRHRCNVSFHQWGDVNESIEIILDEHQIVINDDGCHLLTRANILFYWQSDTLFLPCMQDDRLHYSIVSNSFISLTPSTIILLSYSLSFVHIPRRQQQQQQNMKPSSLKRAGPVNDVLLYCV
jgi:hypothetical protein